MSTSASPYLSYEITSVSLAPFFEEKGVVAREAPAKDQLLVATTINRACQEHGFVHVTNFGMSKDISKKVFAASKELFDNPNKHNDYVPSSPSTNTEFSAFRNESLNKNRPPDLKEAFNTRFPPAWKNPSIPKTPQDFRDVVDDRTQIMKTTAIRYGLICALALDLPIDTFTKTLNTFNTCTSRFLRYPPCDDFMEAANNGETQTASAKVQLAGVRVGEHTDFGAHTFLLLGGK